MKPFGSLHHAALFRPARLVLMLGLALPLAATAQPSHSYPSPEAAAAALSSALKAKDAGQILEVLGPGSHELVLSDNIDQDVNTWERFNQAYDTYHELERGRSGLQILIVGKARYPFPVPLRKTATGWQFDAKAGKEELISRRIGLNELTTIEVLKQIALAQDEYFLMAAREPGRAGEYARRFESSPGKQDGLYWPDAPGKPASPLGPLLARASELGAPGHSRGPGAYFGYRYRMLPGQGKSAPGGARQYQTGKYQIGGFAVLAWPERYGISGIKSFLINQDGMVYERDLGSETASKAPALRLFEPAPGWKPVTGK
ncbi:DUF2950 family protein [Uliginosibacterium aquaticum]|uniref:DUF2950 family protein n=1 Tax=Uliginosibacterium aquaticum TaxID=2731212 RepID=A0ABX2IF47_9RHOO|nr:DUF2950 family protein [Uliginosibacterium aquaticum]NSL55266.1 DUF2950 family protein [Uliginosibacterium aquaticum]